ncbi:hypothetical protein RchiOBHm_Chr2g0141531 [Rosa chinensis]|uniref:Uncharacterized protein n=1 Tax=Rosa chinensis TaxID=74649 RepID=A0A2P6RXP1_ROSCH|nr:hypothetical protein RchiOBHm_Chr2g0141531 [Rosa chinensis]
MGWVWWCAAEKRESVWVRSAEGSFIQCVAGCFVRERKIRSCASDVSKRERQRSQKYQQNEIVVWAFM